MTASPPRRFRPPRVELEPQLLTREPSPRLPQPDAEAALAARPVPQPPREVGPVAIINAVTSPGLLDNPVERLVLLALWSHVKSADAFDAEGNGRCFPSWPRLAAQGSVSVRSVAKVVQQLRARGFISWHREGRRTFYTLYSRPILSWATRWKQEASHAHGAPMHQVHWPEGNPAPQETRPVHTVHGSAAALPLDASTPSMERVHQAHGTDAPSARQVVKETAQEPDPPSSTASQSFPPRDGETSTTAGVISVAPAKDTEPRPSGEGDPAGDPLNKWRLAKGPRSTAELRSVANAGICPYCNGPNPKKTWPCDGCWMGTRTPLTWAEILTVREQEGRNDGELSV